MVHTIKHGTHHKAYKLCIKHNPKSLQKQHGYKPKQTHTHTKKKPKRTHNISSEIC